MLVLGWDAADWLIIDPLLARGRMPNLKRLIEAGVRADLATLEPKLSPLLWTSIATGKTCDKHGILNFVEPKPEGDGLRVSQSTTRKTKAVWNIFSQQGIRTNVIGWYASHPAEPINGHVITNLLQEAEPRNVDASWPLLPGTVHPDALSPVIAGSRQRAHTFPPATLRTLLPKIDEAGSKDEYPEKLRKLMAYAASIEAAAHAVISAGPWDVTMVFFDAIDTVGHHFMQFRPPRMSHVSEREVRLYGDVMDRVYEWHDAALGRLLERAGKDTTVLLLSDHGFYSDARRPNLKGLPPERRMELESSWHRPYGVFVASGPGIAPNAQCGPCTVLDLAPTALALMGLGVGNDMDGRVLTEILEDATEIPKVPSWDAIDGASGMHPADMRQDPFDTTASIQQLVDLGYLAALPEKTKDQLDLVSRESRFNLAFSLLSQHRHAEALPLFQVLSDEAPEIDRYGLCLVQCQNALNDHTGSLRTARTLVERDPANKAYRLVLARALATTGDIPASLREIAPVERAADDRPELWLSLAGVAMLQQRYDVAARFANKAKENDPLDAAAHLALARAKLGQGLFEDAAGHALDALEINQAIPEAHYLLGAALAWLGELADALQSMDLAIQFDPQGQEAVRFALLIASALGDHHAGAKYRTRMNDLDPKTRPPMELPFGPAEFALKQGLPLG